MYGHIIGPSGHCERCDTHEHQIPGLGLYWSKEAICWGAPLCEKYLITELAGHDWQYEYSDDSDARQRGRRQERNIEDLSCVCGERGQLLFDMWKQKRVAK